MKIFIKNMVCNRCISAVSKIFEDAGIATVSIKLGELETELPVTEENLKIIEKNLQQTGFERIKDSTQQITEKIRNLIITKISSLDIADDFVLSEFLSSNLHKDYSLISKTFSQHENVTLEQFFILQKIEKVKELLLYNEFTLTEISSKLGYKSVQHLSAQFRSITGFTPTEFKKLKVHNRRALDLI
ncbi:helix-turn-helix domain-containing protein [Chryseobacterium caseinilyticum]|uniref:Helix-turn-helix transcriptional regulator n=1 Tax=Chryseobacterium caseinilyticum TaxID=2771428 RepID=A0ABR8Z942_9FLAO|nr:AraC family transcriptional regulator [Chryseobacterium caseinilyticum]MBD8081741.1 helix-turn-helix transcriptional regulator [Chryseobacterium caseinilyticum]